MLEQVNVIKIKPFPRFSCHAGAQALHVNHLAIPGIADVAQQVAPVSSLSGCLDGNVHPTGVGTFARVVAFANDLVEFWQVVACPLGQFQGALARNFHVAGATLGVLAGADPASGLFLHRPLQGLAAKHTVGRKAAEGFADGLQHLARQIDGGAELLVAGESVVDA